MSTIEVNKITPVSGGTAIQVGESGDTITIPSGATLTNSGTANNFTNYRPNANPLIINGDMAVAQRSTSVTGVSNGNSGYQTCDRIRFDESGTMGAALTITQESLTSGNAFINGFANAFKVDVTTADSSPDADDWSRINMRLESQDLQVFKKGTSNAEKFTLSFWVKATKTGTNTIELYDADNTRSIGGSYSISSSNTWEHKVVNFAADTTGAFADDNGEGLRISWTLSAGSNYTSGTLPTAWESSTVANTAVGQVNNFDSTSNNFHITGVQLEVGEYTSATIPPFQHESFGDNLQRCRRYCHLHMNTDQDGGPFLGPCFAYTSSNWNASLQLSPPMRAVPTVTFVSGSNYYRIFSNGGTVEYNQIDFNAATLSGGLCTVVDCTLDGANGGTAGHAGKTRGNSTGAGTMMLMDAEL